MAHAAQQLPVSDRYYGSGLGTPTPILTPQPIPDRYRSTAVGFLRGRGIGPQYDGDRFVGAARPFPEGGFLWRFNLTGNRRKIGVDDPRLEDRVADNLNKPSATDPAANAQAIVESESLLFGRDFGVATDIKTGPNGNLFVVSLSNGAIYEIFRR